MIVRPSAAQSPCYRVAGSLHLPAPFGKITQLAFVTKRQYTPATLLSPWQLLPHRNPCRPNADAGKSADAARKESDLANDYQIGIQVL
jgi:hypothetical protein